MKPRPTAEGKAGDTAAADNISRPIILVGVDGSAPSWDAFEWAAGEAKRGNGRIVAVFVTSPIEPGEAFGASMLAYAATADARDQLADELAGQVAARANSLGVEMRFVRATGDAPRVLTEVAMSEQADLLVVGRSAKILHRLAGSVGRRLVLKRDDPVIVVVP